MTQLETVWVFVQRGTDANGQPIEVVAFREVDGVTMPMVTFSDAQTARLQAEAPAWLSVVPFVRRRE